MNSPLRGLVVALNGQDAYELLGVRDDTPQEVIRQAYRLLLKESHSDRHPGPSAEEKTKLLNIAWEILRDYRAEYDQYRHPPADERGSANRWDQAEVAEDPWVAATSGIVPPPSSQAKAPPPQQPQQAWQVPPFSNTQYTPQWSPTRRFSRIRSNRVMYGVCAGLGQYLNVDPAIVRVAAAAFTIFSVGTGIILYFVAVLVVPDEGKATSIAQDLIRKYLTSSNER